MEYDSLEISISANAQKAETSINSLVNRLNTLNASLSRIGTSANKGFGQLSSNSLKLGSNFSRLSLNINTLRGSLKRIDSTISSKLTNSIKGLTNDFKSQLVSITAITAGFKKLADSVRNTSDYIEAWNYSNVAFGKVGAQWSKDWQKYGFENAESYSNSFAERMNDTLSKLSGLKVTIDAEGKGLLSESGSKNLGLNLKEITQYSAQIASITNSLGFTGEATLATSKALTQLAGDISSLFNVNYSTVANNLQSGLIGMSRAMYKYGVDITNASLQTYAYRLGLSKTVSELTQGEKAQLRLIAILDQSKVAFGDLANTINSPSNQLRQLSNNFREISMVIGQLFIPLLSKILPVINGIAIAIKRAVTAFAGFLGVKIDFGSFGTGWSDISTGIDDTTESLDNATGSAKKLNKQLRAFDELKTINLKTDTGSSGAGGAGGGLDLTDDILAAVKDYEDAWNKALEDAENKAETWADEIGAVAKRVFNPLKQAWDTTGDYVMKAWSNALDNIGSLAVTVGKDFMKMWEQPQTVKIFENILGVIGDIGAVVGNLAANFEKAWKKNETGLKIFENIRDAIVIVTTKIREMSTATVEWSEKLNFSPLLEAFERFTAKLAESGGLIENVSGIVSDFYTTVLLPIGTWTIEKGLPNLLDVFTKLTDTIDWQGLRNNLAELWTHLEPFAETVGEGLILFVDKFGTGIANFVNSDNFTNLLDKFEQWLDNVKPEDVANGIKNLAIAFVGLKVAVTGLDILSGVADTFLTLQIIGSGLGSTFSTLSATLASSSIGECFALWAGGAGTLSEAFMATVGPTGAIVAAVTALALGLGDAYAKSEDIQTSFKNAIGVINTNLKDAFNYVTDTVIPDIKEMLNVFKPLTDFLSNTFSSVWRDIIIPIFEKFGNDIMPKVTETVENLWENVFKPFGDFIASVFSPVIQVLSDVLTMLWQNIIVPIADFVMTTFTEAFTGICDIFNEVVVPRVNAVIETFQFLWNEVFSPIVDFLWENLKPAFENVFETIGNVIDNLKDTFSGLINFITGIFTGDWERAWNGIKDVFKGIINGIVSLLEGGINAMVNGLNGFLSGFNNIVESIGDKVGLNISIPKISKVNLPRLATGAIVYKPTIAEIGEEGKEAILPLTNKLAMKTLASEIVANANLVPAPIPNIMPYSNIPSSYITSANQSAVAEYTGSDNAELLYEIRKQNALAERQNTLLAAILNKPVIDDDMVYDSFSRAQYQHFRSTGNTGLAGI